jgi:hypothetical protein
MGYSPIKLLTSGIHRMAIDDHSSRAKLLATPLKEALCPRGLPYKSRSRPTSNEDTKLLFSGPYTIISEPVFG